MAANKPDPAAAAPAGASEDLSQMTSEQLAERLATTTQQLASTQHERDQARGELATTRTELASIGAERTRIVEALRLLEEARTKLEADQATLKEGQEKLAADQQTNNDLSQRLMTENTRMENEKRATLGEIDRRMQAAELRERDLLAAITKSENEIKAKEAQLKNDEKILAAREAALKVAEAKVESDSDDLRLGYNALRAGHAKLIAEQQALKNERAKLGAAANSQPLDPEEERKLREHHQRVLTQYRDKHLPLIKLASNNILDGIEFYFPHPDPKKELTQKAWEVGYGGVVTIHGVNHPDAATRKTALAHSIILAMALHEGSVVTTDASGAMKAQLLAIAKELYANGELVGPDGKPLVNRNGQPLKQIIFDGVVLGDYGPSYGLSTPPKLAAAATAKPPGSGPLPSARMAAGPSTI